MLLIAVSANAEEAISCSVDASCPDSLLCVADRTDRTGRTGICSQPSQWAGDECSFLIGDHEENIVDSCDHTMNLVCVSSAVRAGYTCQKAVTTMYGGCLSTAASYASQCSGNLVCIAYPGARQEGQCRVPASTPGMTCSNLVISGPGYIETSCAEGLTCMEGQCVQVTEDGTCSLAGDVANQVFCTSGHACVDGTCVEQPSPMYCNGDGNCRSNQYCINGQCMMAAMDGVCDENPQLPFADQLYCEPGKYCMPTEAGPLMCAPDKCEGRCQPGTKCDNDIKTCVELEECSTATQSPCCQVTKNVQQSCPASKCVCDFDSACCEDNGWDYYCVKHAMQYCNVKC